MKGLLKKCGLYVALFALLSTVLLPASSVKAISPYDNLIVLTDTLTVTGDCSTTPVLNDISLNWSTYITDTSLYWANHSPAHKQKLETQGRDSLLNAFNNGRWAVSQSGANVYVYWTEDTSLTLNFATAGPQNNIRVARVSGNNVHQAIIRTTCGYAGQDPEKVIFDNVAISSSFEFASSLYPNIFTYFFYGTINYPPDYEGEEIPDTVTPVASDYPKIGYSVNNLKVTAHNLTDTEHTSLKDYPYTVRWQIVDPVGNMIVEKSLGKTDQFTHTFEDLPDEPFEYTLRVILKDAPPPHQSFEQLGYNFKTAMHQLKVDGGFYVGSTELDNCSEYNGQVICQNEATFPLECIKDSFPYFNISDCMATVQALISSLSFNTITFGQEWSHQPECYQMQVLHNWLHLNKSQLCPQFPASIRNTVTPFITFALGLLTILFISRRADKYT